MIKYHHVSLFAVAFTTLLLARAEQSDPAVARVHAPTMVAFNQVQIRPVVAPRVVRRRRPCLASRGMSLVQRYAFYENLVKQHHGQVAATTVLGLRGLAPTGRRHSSADNASNYDDTFVILQRQKGRLRVTEMLGSTHAGQVTSSLSPNGVAQIQPGNFRAVPAGEHEGMPCYAVSGTDGRGTVPCWRDVDRDGRISPEERRHPRTADGILFHNGRFTDHGSSIGCQTLPPDKFRRFLQIVGTNRSFNYTLVDANKG